MEHHRTPYGASYFSETSYGASYVASLSVAIDETTTPRLISSSARPRTNVANELAAVLRDRAAFDFDFEEEPAEATEAGHFVTPEPPTGPGGRAPCLLLAPAAACGLRQERLMPLRLQTAMQPRR